MKCCHIINENGEKEMCDGKVKFKQCAKLGIGFQITIECKKCQPSYILSCQKIGKANEVNRRFIFVMCEYYS